MIYILWFKFWFHFIILLSERQWYCKLLFFLFLNKFFFHYELEYFFASNDSLVFRLSFKFSLYCKYVTNFITIDFQFIVLTNDSWWRWGVGMTHGIHVKFHIWFPLTHAARAHTHTHTTYWSFTSPWMYWQLCR